MSLSEKSYPLDVVDNKRNILFHQDVTVRHLPVNPSELVSDPPADNLLMW